MERSNGFGGRKVTQPVAQRGGATRRRKCDHPAERHLNKMADLEAVLDEAGLTNPKVREFVKQYAELTGAERVEVVNASDDARLIEEALAAGELERAGEGRYYSRSYHKDTARSEERTIVATNDAKDRGVYNNWRPASEMKPLLHDRMRGASEGKTMYVIPYLMAPPGNPLEPWATGVELTDTRTVVLHMIRMARVGVQFVNDLEDPDSFVRVASINGPFTFTIRVPFGLQLLILLDSVAKLDAIGGERGRLPTEFIQSSGVDVSFGVDCGLRSDEALFLNLFANRPLIDREL